MHRECMLRVQKTGTMRQDKEPASSRVAVGDFRSNGTISSRLPFCLQAVWIRNLSGYAIGVSLSSYTGKVPARRSIAAL